MRSLLGPVLNRAEQISFAPPGYAGSMGYKGLFGGGRNTDTLMAQMETSGILFAIVNRTSTATSAANWHLYKKAKSGKKEDRTEVPSHAAIDLWEQPNKFMSRQELVEVGQQHVDLVGESSLFVARDDRYRALPLELWPVRPDRIAPVPHPVDFISGYIYSSPSGEQVPLDRDQILQIRMPNPRDMYRGLGPVQSVLTELNSAKFSAEWNRNFFINGAEPGGIIKLNKTMSDVDFRQFRERWSEGHKGVANAHKVAVLTEGEWVDRKLSQRDMQFVELRLVSRDTIMEAFGIHKIAVGISDDVNKANATAGKALFAEDLTVPRLERWKGLLNNDFLPLYGKTAVGLEWDYDSPVPADAEAENADRKSRVDAAVALIREGADPKATLEAFGLPDIEFREQITAGAPGATPAAAEAESTLAFDRQDDLDWGLFGGDDE